MIAVFIIIYKVRLIITVEIATEDRYIKIWITPCKVTTPSWESSVNFNTVNQLKRSLARVGKICYVRRISTLCHPYLVSV